MITSTSHRANGSRREVRLRKGLVSVAKHAALLALSMFVLVPLWLVIVTSFKPLGEASQLDLSWPHEWRAAENYDTVITQGNYVRSLLNSILVTGASIAIALIVGSLAAWAFGRSRSRVMNTLYYVCVVGVLLPPAIVPTIFLLKAFGLQGDYAGLILFTAGTRLALVIFLMTGFVKSLPPDMEDAARVDGATSLQVFRLVVLPVLRPVLFTVFIILLMVTWNDFFAPFFLLHGPERATLPLSLYQFSDTSIYQVSWNLIFAHVVLVSLPLIIAFVLAQRQVTAGLTSGAVRG